jgi:NADH-quinone oxidoreductase subunit H
MAIALPFLTGLGMVVFVLINIIFFMWAEFKIAGRVVDRYGPMETGRFHGWLQPMADIFKFLNKEDIIPAQADKLVFKVAPFVGFIPMVMTLVAVPYTYKLMIRNLDIGAFYIIALSSFTFVSLIMGGWASSNKYSLLGAFRAAGQLLSYELPLGLAIAGVVMISATLNLAGIVAQQTVWNIFLQPIGFLVFMIAMQAELQRSPFDLAVAESELVAGYSTEYSGMRFALFQLGEFFGLWALACLTVILFLGGWHGPVLPGVVWFFIKFYAIFVFLAFSRVSVPRVRPDQLMTLGWKVLLPAGLANILITSVLIVTVHNYKLPLAIAGFIILFTALFLVRRVLK